MWGCIAPIRKNSPETCVSGLAPVSGGQVDRPRRWAAARLLGIAKRCAGSGLTELEPHYAWGPYGWERLDGMGEGEGRYVQLEWLGLKLSIAVGRRPRKVGNDDGVV